MPALTAKNVTCPYCWHSFKENALHYRCGDACAEVDRQKFTAKESQKGMCPHGRRPVSRRFCPSCGHTLLREYIESDGRNVAVIGSADAGKTTYIGVLLHELRGRVSSQFNGMALDLLGDESRKNYTERFSDPLYNRGQAVRKTVALRGDDTIEPLIFTLKIPTPKSAFQRGGGVKSLLSVFYDASGENVLSANAMDPLARYLETAGGIVLLIDPMQMPRVRETFGRGLPPARNLFDQAAVVERLAELLRESAKKGQQRLDRPLAIAITKVDALRDSFDDDSPLNRMSNHNGQYDDDDGRDVHEEMRGWLEQWFGPAFDNTVSANFSDYRYFGLTALGAPPVDEMRLSPSGIHPYRVEDPMLWLLARFGSIKSTGAKR